MSDTSLSSILKKAKEKKEMVNPATLTGYGYKILPALAGIGISHENKDNAETDSGSDAGGE